MKNTADQQQDRTNWIKKVLTDNSAGTFLALKEVVVTPYSRVMEVTTSSGIYYFKETPPDLFIEAKILNLLRQYDPAGAFPHIIASDEMSHRFLMSSCGEQTLRTLFKGALDAGLITKAIQHYKDIQKATSTYLADFKHAGVADWSLDRFPQLFADLISQKEFLAACGLSEEDCQKLDHLQDKLAQICHEINAYGLPAALKHSDFQDNNMVIDTTTGTVTIIDWGEVTIGHPLLSIVGCFKKICWRYKIIKDSTEYNSLRNDILSGWNLPQQDIPSLYDRISAIDNIYYALTLVELIKSSTEKRPDWYERIKMACHSFIDECSNLDLQSS